MTKNKHFYEQREYDQGFSDSTGFQHQNGKGGVHPSAAFEVFGCSMSVVGNNYHTRQASPYNSAGMSDCLGYGRSCGGGEGYFNLMCETGNPDLIESIYSANPRETAIEIAHWLYLNREDQIIHYDLLLLRNL